MKDRRIHGYRVRYEDDVIGCVRYLENELDENELKALFDEARRRRMAEFEDSRERDYILTYSSSGIYTLTKRDH